MSKDNNRRKCICGEWADTPHSIVSNGGVHALVVANPNPKTNTVNDLDVIEGMYLRMARLRSPELREVERLRTRQAIKALYTKRLESMMEKKETLFYEVNVFREFRPTQAIPLSVIEQEIERLKV